MCDTLQDCEREPGGEKGERCLRPETACTRRVERWLPAVRLKGQLLPKERWRRTSGLRLKSSPTESRSSGLLVTACSWNFQSHSLLCLPGLGPCFTLLDTRWLKCGMPARVYTPAPNGENLEGNFGNSKYPFGYLDFFLSAQSFSSLPPFPHCTTSDRWKENVLTPGLRRQTTGRNHFCYCVTLGKELSFSVLHR